MSSQNLGKDSNEYFSECFSLVKIVLMIEFCWKRFLKVLHFHKYHGFTWAEFLLILFYSNFQRVKEDVMKLEKRGVLQFSSGN